MIKSEIQLVRSLAEKRGRQELGLFIAEGEKFIGELLDSPLRVRKIYVTEQADIDPSFSSRTELEIVSEREMERISQLKSANRALALVEMPRRELHPEELSSQLSIMLDGVQNPGNLGTIIRLADWFGIESVICSPDSADCFNPKVVQATMGAILRVKVHYCPLPPLIQSLNVPIYGAMLEGENIYHANLSPTGVIVMGNEGQGVSPEVQSLITQRLYIPPYPTDQTSSESLNVAIATAVICSEFRRR